MPTAATALDESGQSLPSAPLTFELAFEELKERSNAGVPLEESVAACLVAESARVDAHKAYGEGCQFLLSLGLLDEAEELAARTVRAAPDCGGGCHLFGDIYKTRGDDVTANSCYRYLLPENIVQKHFPLAEDKKTSLEQESVSGVRKADAYPADQYTLPQPVRVESRAIPKLERSERVVTGNPAFTAIIPGGRVWFDGVQLTVWDAAQRVYLDLCRGNPEIINNLAEPSAALYLPGKVCMLGNRNAVNFYHWMNDVLPALEVLQASGQSLDSVDKFIVNPLGSGFQKQTLAHFGIGEDRIHQVSVNKHVRCDELLVPRYGSNSLGMKQSRWLAEFMKREFLFREQKPEEAPAAYRRIYISRADSGVRGVSNETELLDFLKPYNFEIIRAADLSIEQQARVFSEAKFVLGPHGAAFSNVLFCQPGTKLIELVNTHFESCFWGAAGMCEMDYYVVSHKPQAADELSGESLIQKTIRLREANFEVDINEIEQILAAAGCEKI